MLGGADALEMGQHVVEGLVAGGCQGHELSELGDGRGVAAWLCWCPGGGNDALVAVGTTLLRGCRFVGLVLLLLRFALCIAWLATVGPILSAPNVGWASPVVASEIAVVATGDVSFASVDAVEFVGGVVGRGLKAA